MLSELSNSVKLIDENETLNLTSWPRPRGLYDLPFSLCLPGVALATLIFFGTIKLAQIYLSQAFKCVLFFFFFPFLSFYAWPFPISGIQKDLTGHLKVALSSLFSLCILFVSFIASQQFAAILYPCICCLLPPVQVHEASPCSFRPRAALGAQQIFGEWMNESMRNRTGTWRAGWWAVNSRPLLDNMEGNPG